MAHDYNEILKNQLEYKNKQKYIDQLEKLKEREISD